MSTELCSGFMCRSIKTLRAQAPPADEEVAAAALQFVRKVSGYRHPSRANAQAFNGAVEEIAGATRRLLTEMTGAVASESGQPRT